MLGSSVVDFTTKGYRVHKEGCRVYNLDLTLLFNTMLYLVGLINPNILSLKIPPKRSDFLKKIRATPITLRKQDCKQTFLMHLIIFQFYN